MVLGLSCCSLGAWGLLALLLLLPLPGVRGRCPAPPQLRSAHLIEQDSSKSYFPAGTTVSYVCRPGYESREQTHKLTCRENRMWSEAREFCSRKSCPAPKISNGRAEGRNFQHGERVKIICDDGFTLEDRNFIDCILKGDKAEWSELPVCKEDSSDWRSLAIGGGVAAGILAILGGIAAGIANSG